VQLSNELVTLVQKFSEHYHDAWASRKMEAGWIYAEVMSPELKRHRRLKPYNLLDNFEKETYREPVRCALKALIALGWQIEYSEGDFTSPLAQRAAAMQVRDSTEFR
jgi:ryanodine receptor 2